MLNFHLARDKVTENLHISQRALLATFLNRRAAVRLKIEQERLEKFLVKQVTRMMPVAAAERGQAQSRLFIRDRDLQRACSPAAIVTLSNRIRLGGAYQWEGTKWMLAC